MDKCACDECDTVFGAHDLRSPDGYCAFCAMSCFPASSFAGRMVRGARSKQERKHLHAAARVVKSAQENLPHDPRAVAEAARQEAADAAVQLLGPIVERKGRDLINLVRKKIKGEK